MRMQIKEFSVLTGVSVRTLHYYDEIGLLKPACVDEYSGYRYYDENSLKRMQEILFYRELNFSLKSISEILSSPGYDRNKALEEQKKLLVLKKERLERLISAIDEAVKGETVMTAFDKSEFEKYKSEVEEKWGKTDAFKEHTEKTRSYTKGKWDSLTESMDGIIAELACCKKNGLTANSGEAEELVKKLQDFITENYYTCTDEILSGLGQMYVLDERFKNNIDRHGDGTAEYIGKAIEAYISRSNKN